MVVQELFIQFFVAVLKILGAIVLSIGALYTGIKMLDSLTQGIDEWKEIKKGNLAVGILYTAVIVSLIVLIAPRIDQFVSFIQPALPLQTTVVLLLLAFLNYLLDLLLSIVIIYLTINLINKLTVDLDEMMELKKGNVAVALIMSAILLSVAFVSRFSLDYTFNIINALESLILG